MSGHIFFQDRWYGFDDGVYAALRLLEIVSHQKESLESIYQQLPKGIVTPEYFIPVDDDKKFALMQKIIALAKRSSLSLCLVDGLRIDFDDAWGLVRCSNTNACLTCRFEADDEAAMLNAQKAILDFVRQAYPEARIDWAS